MSKPENKYYPETIAIRAGNNKTQEQEHSEAIFATSSFVFDSSEHAARRFSGASEGNVYSRFTNPTVTHFTKKLAQLEGGKYGLATASGMAAINGLVMSMLRSGDHIVASKGMFGSTVSLFSKYLTRFAIEISFVDLADPLNWQKAVQPNTRLFFLETPSNPLCEMADIRAIADIANQNGVLLAVDNAFLTPILQQPLKHGAHVVIHSATKYLDGQGRCVGGALVTNDAEIYEDLFSMLRTTGPCLSPFNAWTFSKGLETLAIRMKQHCENAAVVANWLDGHTKTKKVYYPGLDSHPQHLLAKNQMLGFGGIVSFEVEGGKEQAWKIIDSVQFISRTANLGDVKTTITHPATTTHARISQAERDAAGIQESLIRLSVGLEHPEDVIRDLESGLGKV